MGNCECRHINIIINNLNLFFAIKRRWNPHKHTHKKNSTYIFSLLGVWGSTHQLQRADQVFETRVQMQIQTLSQLGVHLCCWWCNRRAWRMHLSALRLHYMHLLSGRYFFNRYFRALLICFTFQLNYEILNIKIWNIKY